MRKITLSEYNAIPENYRGIWTVERWDLPDWAEIRKRHIGKRTMMVYDKGTCLLVEGIGFEIVDDSGWKKPDEIRKDIDMLYQEFCNMCKCEPHYADCIIRWQDTRIHWKQELHCPWIPIRNGMKKSSIIATAGTN